MGGEIWGGRGRERKNTRRKGSGREKEEREWRGIKEGWVNERKSEVGINYLSAKMFFTFYYLY